MQQGAALLCALLLASSANSALDWDLALPAEHIPLYFRQRPDLKESCIEDPECPYKVILCNS